MAFTLNETYFSGKFTIWRYLTSISSKIAQVEVFGHFLDFAPLVFLDFGHNDWCAWCLVVFLQFTGPVNVFLLFFNMANLLQIKLWEVLEKNRSEKCYQKTPVKDKTPVKLQAWPRSYLTHFQPMSHFYIHWKHWKTWCFQWV